LDVPAPAVAVKLEGLKGHLPELVTAAIKRCKTKVTQNKKSEENFYIPFTI
jgi:hypothetical protein